MAAMTSFDALTTSFSALHYRATQYSQLLYSWDNLEVTYLPTPFDLSPGLTIHMLWTPSMSYWGHKLRSCCNRRWYSEILLASTLIVAPSLQHNSTQNYCSHYPQLQRRRRVWRFRRGPGEFVISGCLAPTSPLYKKITGFLHFAWTPLGSSGERGGGVRRTTGPLRPATPLRPLLKYRPMVGSATFASDNWPIIIYLPYCF